MENLKNLENGREVNTARITPAATIGWGAPAPEGNQPHLARSCSCPGSPGADPVSSDLLFALTLFPRTKTLSSGELHTARYPVL